MCTAVRQLFRLLPSCPRCTACNSGGRRVRGQCRLSSRLRNGTSAPLVSWPRGKTGEPVKAMAHLGRADACERGFCTLLRWDRSIAGASLRSEAIRSGFQLAK